MSRAGHPNRHIEAALRYAESLGCVVQKSGPRAHVWGRILCPQSTRAGCIVSVYSTPRVPENHARHLRREIDTCPHLPPPPPAVRDAEAEGTTDDN